MRKEVLAITYKMIGGFDETRIYPHNPDSFGAGYGVEPIAIIHSNNKEAYVIAPGVVGGLKADNLAHAWIFLRSLLGITHVKDGNNLGVNAGDKEG